VKLYPTLTNEGPSFHVPVHDDVARYATAGLLKRVELQIVLEHLSSADRIQVNLDGKALGEPVVRYAAREDPDDPSDVAEHASLVWTLRPGQVAQGEHRINVQLLKRDKRVRPPLVVRHVEFHVNYS